MQGQCKSCGLWTHAHWVLDNPHCPFPDYLCVTPSSWVWPKMVNSLAPGKFEWNFRYVIFKRISVIGGWGNSCEIALTWKPPDLTDDKSTLAQVMAWCRQATSHYLSQCWPILCRHMYLLLTSIFLTFWHKLQEFPWHYAAKCSKCKSREEHIYNKLL